MHTGLNAGVSRRRNRYAWLLFDADGTLFDYDRAEASALAQCFSEIGLAFGPAHLEAYRRINREQWLALERGQTTPAQLKVRRFELLLDFCGAAHPAEPLSERYLEALALSSELIEGADDLVRALREDHRIAVLTNGLKAVQRSRLERSVIRDCIDAIVISEEVGAAKPARAYFEAAFAKIGRPMPHETLMIGDNWSSDIQGATDYGIDCCWYNPKGTARPESPAITYEIQSLDQLRSILRQPG